MSDYLRTYSLGELDHIAFGPASRIEWVRNMSRLDLIPYAVGERDVGTGRSRQFSFEAADCLMVMALMSDLGMTLTGRKEFICKVARDIDLHMALQDLRDAERGCC